MPPPHSTTFSYAPVQADPNARFHSSYNTTTSSAGPYLKCSLRSSPHLVQLKRTFEYISLSPHSPCPLTPVSTLALPFSYLLACSPLFCSSVAVACARPSQGVPKAGEPRLRHRHSHSPPRLCIARCVVRSSIRVYNRPSTRWASTHFDGETEMRG